MLPPPPMLPAANGHLSAGHVSHLVSGHGANVVAEHQTRGSNILVPKGSSVAEADSIILADGSILAPADTFIIGEDGTLMMSESSALLSDNNTSAMAAAGGCATGPVFTTPHGNILTTAHLGALGTTRTEEAGAALAAGAATAAVCMPEAGAVLSDVGTNAAASEVLSTTSIPQFTTAEAGDIEAGDNGDGDIEAGIVEVKKVFVNVNKLSRNDPRREKLRMKELDDSETDSDMEEMDTVDSEEGELCAVCLHSGDTLYCCERCDGKFHAFCSISAHAEASVCILCSTHKEIFTLSNKRRKGQLSERDLQLCRRLLYEMYNVDTIFDPIRDYVALSYYPADVVKIRETITLDVIKKALEDKDNPQQYSSVRSFLEDLRKMFRNCFTINQKESLVFKHFLLLKEKLRSLLNLWTPKFADMLEEAYDDEDNNAQKRPTDESESISKKKLMFNKDLHYLKIMVTPSPPLTAAPGVKMMTPLSPTASTMGGGAELPADEDTATVHRVHERDVLDTSDQHGHDHGEDEDTVTVHRVHECNVLDTSDQHGHDHGKDEDTVTMQEAENFLMSPVTLSSMASTTAISDLSTTDRKWIEEMLVRVFSKTTQTISDAIREHFRPETSMAPLMSPLMANMIPDGDDNNTEATTPSADTAGTEQEQEDGLQNIAETADPRPELIFTEVDGLVLVFTDGYCHNNGRDNARAGIGVWWESRHPANISQPLQGDHQTTNVAELEAVKLAINQAFEANIKRLVSPK